jgi:hypothetical protein
MISSLELVERLISKHRNSAAEIPTFSGEAFAAQAPEHRLGDEPIEAQYREQLTKVAQELDLIFNGQIGGSDRKTGFILLVFPFGEGEGRCNFVSNGADRRDVMTLMREMQARFEGQPEMSGRA